MQGESDLDKIFEEKLFIKKKEGVAAEYNAGAEDKENAGNAAGWHQSWHGHAPLTPKSANREIRKNHVSKEAVPVQPIHMHSASNLPKEISLEGIYQNTDMEDVYKTKVLIENGSLREAMESEAVPQDIVLPSVKEATNRIKTVRFAGEPSHFKTMQDNSVVNTSHSGHAQAPAKEQYFIENKSDAQANQNASPSAGSNRVVYTVRQGIGIPADPMHVEQMSESMAGLGNGTEAPESAVNQNREGASKLAFETHEAVYKSKCRAIEEEFNRLKTTHAETLKLKSKIYKFISTEIYKIDLKYAARIQELEAENKELKARADRLNRKYEKYQEFIATNVNELKKRVIEAMKEYRQRHKNGVQKSG